MFCNLLRRSYKVITRNRRSFPLIPKSKMVTEKMEMFISPLLPSGKLIRKITASLIYNIVGHKNPDKPPDNSFQILERSSGELDGDKIGEVSYLEFGDPFGIRTDSIFLILLVFVSEV